MNKTLIVKESHLKLLKELNIGWDDMEFGGPCVDPKRPFGNSDVYKDMAEILCLDMPDEETQPKKYERFCDNLLKGYQELQDCLQILCQHLTISTGKYECGEYSNIWTKVEE